MMKNKTVGNLANIQVYRDEVHRAAGQAPEITYYLGWGKYDVLQGDPLTFEELKALHALMGRVIEQNTMARKYAPFRCLIFMFKTVSPALPFYILYRTSIFNCCFRQKEV